MPRLLALCALLAALASAAPTNAASVAETFDTDPFAAGRWKMSKNSKYARQAVEVMPSSSAPEAFQGDLGVQLTKEMLHYGFGTTFAPLDLATGEEPLIVQYEVKFDEPLTCGGAYIKLLRRAGTEATNMERLDNASPYSIMFGPDKCGTMDKVHFIFQHQNPVTGAWEEKHFNETVSVKSDAGTHLYTLELLPGSGDFKVSVDDKLVEAGNLLTHMTPAVNPPAEIDDPTDKKPADWVDDELIDDVVATKPDDWDEAQPRKVPDTSAQKPADWLEDEPQEVPNPEAVKPADWDDEEDGEWDAPLVPNPRCLEAAGCGRWTPPLVDNPRYKGKWVRPKVANPRFVGHWRPRQMPNPAFFRDTSPARGLAPIEGLAVEVWTTNAGLHFDNFLLTRDAVERTSFAEKFRAKRRAEKDKLRGEKADRDAQINSYRSQFHFLMLQYVHYAAENPAVLAATLGGILASLLLVCGCACRGGPKKQKQPKSESEPAAAEPAAAEPAAAEPIATEAENNDSVPAASQ